MKSYVRERLHPPLSATLELFQTLYLLSPRKLPILSTRKSAAGPPFNPRSCVNLPRRLHIVDNELSPQRTIAPGQATGQPRRFSLDLNGTVFSRDLEIVYSFFSRLQAVVHFACCLSQL